MHGKRGVTADTALRLSHFVGTSTAFWMNLQARYDVEVAQERLADDLRRIIPLSA